MFINTAKIGRYNCFSWIFAAIGVFFPKKFYNIGQFQLNPLILFSISYVTHSKLQKYVSNKKGLKPSKTEE